MISRALSNSTIQVLLWGAFVALLSLRLFVLEDDGGLTAALAFTTIAIGCLGLWGQIEGRTAHKRASSQAQDAREGSPWRWILRALFLVLLVPIVLVSQTIVAIVLIACAVLSLYLSARLPT